VCPQRLSPEKAFIDDGDDLKRASSEIEQASFSEPRAS
jgi:hypothetical protein